jgi:hypothetical protein
VRPATLFPHFAVDLGTKLGRNSVNTNKTAKNNAGDDNFQGVGDGMSKLKERYYE